MSATRSFSEAALKAPSAQAAAGDGAARLKTEVMAKTSATAVAMRRVIESVTRADCDTGTPGFTGRGVRCGPSRRWPVRQGPRCESAGAPGRSYRQAGALRAGPQEDGAVRGCRPRPRLGQGRRRSDASARRARIQVRAGLDQLRFADLGADLVGPDALGGLDRAQRLRPGRREGDELRSPVSRVVHVCREAVADSRSATRWTLWRARFRARAILGDRHRRMVRGGEDLPAGARLAGGTRHLVAGGGEDPVESKHLDHEAAEGVAGGGSSDRLSRRSRGGFFIDRMLSLWYAGRHDSILSHAIPDRQPHRRPAVTRKDASRASEVLGLRADEPRLHGPPADDRAVADAGRRRDRTPRRAAGPGPFVPYTSLWSRLDGFDPAELGRMVADRSVVRTSLMRGTIHMVTARDALFLRPILQPVLERVLRQSSPFARAVAGINEAALFEAGRTMVEAEPLSRAKLSVRLAERFPGYDPLAMAYMVAGLIPMVQVPPRGVWGAKSIQATWTTLSSWIRDPRRSRDARRS